MGHAAAERRKFERFDLNAPALLEDEGQKQSIKLFTRDISAGGVFLLAAAPLAIGAKVKVEIVIPNETIEDLTGTRFQLRVYGTVVRIEDSGMAISFKGQAILPVGSMMDN
ncbi:MAG: PilZ domain-containing protein [Pseudomonadota bacterium]